MTRMKMQSHEAMERKIDAKVFLLKETKFQAQVHLLRGETREVGESKLTQWIYRAYEKGDSTKQGQVGGILPHVFHCLPGKKCRKLEMSTSKPTAEVLRCRPLTRVYPETLPVSNHQTSSLMKSWNSFPWKMMSSNLHSIYIFYKFL